MLLKEIIKEICPLIFEADNGKSAIELLQTKTIDIVLMDIEMPVMNGVETTKYIRENFSFPKNKIPIIALTAHNPADFFSNYNNAGFDNLLTKPYSFEKILKAIKKFRSID
ncbi:MAG: hypothetical protein A2X13_01515 [Bacteroidetes bacterium GWC2_33_15]|nr:MAG: hypothetical protein A2X10_08110 [Bacteroidetes bacterium GWA2_33_15]OFX52160.1 MAG: hypothetical protein A2X13_01515 [Bacteroidetes bacterium GWC2_33_15]OFX64314.1 MAG: hypothetical protein A2X15_12335 [Bacteroidetes bacterium GWB2_32_14]OFX67719.1 MAG: hypothetical protein A2X14_06160 [Bacteroidetes bacterium GWD2_33_33]